MRFSNLGNINGVKDSCKFSSVVSIIKVFFKVCRDLFVLNGGRDGDGDGRIDWRLKVKNGGSDSYVLVRDGVLDINIWSDDGNGVIKVNENLRDD